MAVIDLSGILPQSFDRCTWTLYCKLGPWSNGAFRSTLFSFCGAHVEGYGHFDIKILLNEASYVKLSQWKKSEKFLW